MESSQAISGTGRRKAFRLAGLSFADKVAAGFGLVIALLLCAVIIAGLGAHAARTGADEVKNRHLPLMETALALEGLVYEAVFHVSMFGSSGAMASYSGARIRFATIRDTAAYLAEQAAGIPEGREIVRDMDSLRGLTRQLDLVVEKKRTLNDALAAERVKLRRAADAMGDILLDLQARTASVATADGGAKTRDEKARLLALNGFALAVEAVTGQAVAAGVGKSANDLARAETYFAERWREGREACAAAALLPASGAVQSVADAAKEMESLAATFREIMGQMRFNLEEGSRLTGDRTEITENLTMLTRGLVAQVRANMELAATRADTALAGATVTLFAGALLACILAVGAAIGFVRSRPVTSAAD
ncbi:hypothetical protein LJC26_03270 [Desulfovibrio sp. OttesenSCG-928-O18]|nr:hypothetical protein [Desulfovibrio sp. OttesenSCG-928-O18]